MKIMYLMFSFTMGGTERLVADICNEMAVRGNEVFLYIVNDLYEESLLRMLDDRVCVFLQKRAAGSGGRIDTMRRVAGFIRKHRIEVVHCNSFDTPELLMLRPVLFPKTKIIYTIHGMGQYKAVSRLRRWYRNRICDKIIAISESVKKDIEACGAAPRKTVTVYNAINLKTFSVDGRKAFDEKQIVIGNVARIKPEEKGQDILIAAVALLKDRYPAIRCFFAGAAGEGNQAVLGKLKEQAKRLCVEKSVVFLGNVENVAGFLHTLDLFVLPSRSEGFGLALVEAMASGVPCIASNLNGPAEIIGDETYGFLFPCEDAEALAQKISFAIENYGECLDKAEKAAAYVRQAYGMDDMCKKLMQIYQVVRERKK